MQHFTDKERRDLAVALEAFPFLGKRFSVVVGTWLIELMCQKTIKERNRQRAHDS